MRHKTLLVLAIFATSLLVPAHSPALAVEEGESEFGAMFGLAVGDTPLVGDGKDDDPNPAIGLRLGHLVSPRWALFSDLTFVPYEAVDGFNTNVMSGRLGAELLFQPESNWHWFLGAGLGLMNIRPADGAGVHRGLVSAGFGQRHEMVSGSTFRWELRADRSIDDNGLGGETVTNILALVGISIGFGAPPADTDGDGVPDRRDRCPDTPRGATVDERGCPTDEDGDGVYDGIDHCPGTPSGWPVDAKGCPLDSDGDGVPDGADKCPDTPKGARVDERGCPSDADGDGVYDGIDACPDTPKAVKVDAKGCPVDGDGDGVPDGIDQCPGTPNGAKVDAKGCPMDSDGDGVYDGIDRCPGTPAGTKVDATGCPETKLFEEGKRSLVLEGVYFELNSAVLTPNSKTILDRVARSLSEWPDVHVEIGGHTDSQGSDAYNLKLSEQRARAVRDYLIANGVDASRLTARGYGEQHPIADNGTAEGRAKNRRVELTRLD